MTAAWHYQENGDSRGPVSGAQLKKLAEEGVVVPWSPVKRIEGSAESPWARAGEVTGLFSEGQDELLGDPICGECGRVMQDGECSACMTIKGSGGAAQARASTLAEQQSQEHPGRSVGGNESPLQNRLNAAWEAFLRVVGIIEIGYGWITSTAWSVDSELTGRFVDDNAIGATANTLELLSPSVAALPHILLGVSIILYVELRRIRRAI